MSTGVPRALQISAWEIVVAFGMSVAIGLVVGLSVGLHRFSHRSFMPIILLLYGTPSYMQPQSILNGRVYQLGMVVRF